jgi:hypothetical protein
MVFFLKVLAGGKIAQMFGGPKSAGKEDSGSRTTRQILAEETIKNKISVNPFRQNNFVPKKT